MGIFDESIKSAIDRQRYEGFDDCARITFHVLNYEKETLMKKVSKGDYWTPEEQYYLSKIEQILQKLSEEFDDFRY